MENFPIPRSCLLNSCQSISLVFVLLLRKSLTLLLNNVFHVQRPALLTDPNLILIPIICSSFILVLSPVQGGFSCESLCGPLNVTDQ